MALLGSTVDPRLFVQDYSGFTRAADIQGQSMANIGANVGSVIKGLGEDYKDKKQLEAGIKATVTGIESAIKMGESLGIDVKSSLTPYLDKINDPNVSPIEAAAYAQQASNSISNVLNFGMKANEMGIEKERYKQATAARIAELQAESRKPVEMKLDKFVVGETEVDVLTDKFGNMYDPQSRSKIVDIPGYAAGKPLEQVTEKGASLGPSLPNFPAPYYTAPVGGSVNNGEVLPSLGNAAVPQLSAEQQALMDSEGAAYPDGVAITGTPLEGATPPVTTERPIEQRVAELAGPTYTPIPQPRSADAIQKAADLTEQAPVSAITPRGRPAEKEAKGEVVTPEEVNRRIASGLSVTAIPIGDGKVRITSQTGSPKPSPVIESPESKLQTQRLLKLDESLGSLREAGTTASLDIQPLKEITNLLDTNVKTGFGRETLMQAKKILGQDVSNEEEFQAMVGAEAMKNIALTKGAISDREMDYFKTVLSPNMGKTTEGNKKIIDFRIKYADRASKISETISDLQEQGRSPFEIKKAVDKIISSESLFDNRGSDKTKVNQADEDAKFLGGF